MASVWVKSTAYSLGDQVVNTTLGTQWYTCIKAGQSRSVTPFNNSTDLKGAVIQDYQVKWRCDGEGGPGNIKFTYSGTSFVLVGAGLEVKWTYGNPNSKATRKSGTTGPRVATFWIGEEVFQINGTLTGPGTLTDIANAKSVFKNRFELDTITMTMTGYNATKYGATKNVMSMGSTGIRITPMKGTTYLHIVDIQVMVVDN